MPMSAILYLNTLFELELNMYATYNESYVS